MMRPTPAPFARAASKGAEREHPLKMYGLTKRIVDPRALKAFQQSATYKDILAFIQQLSEAVTGKQLTQAVTVRPFVAALRDALDQLSRWIAEIPPADQAMRYGNVAYKDWYARLVAFSPRLMGELLSKQYDETGAASSGGEGERSAVLPATFIASAIPTRAEFDASLTRSDAERRALEASYASKRGSSSIAAPPLPPSPRPAAVSELAGYFAESFGNVTRIDYGTGHELSFVVWLHCLERLQLLVPEDRPALVTVVFQRYLTLMRELQSTYRLEPAGSHGVWGLDDYQFLPFLFGAAQLIGNGDGIEPMSIHDERLLEEKHGEYLYLAAVRFIRQMKRGPWRALADAQRHLCPWLMADRRPRPRPHVRG